MFEPSLDQDKAGGTSAMTINIDGKYAVYVPHDYHGPALVALNDSTAVVIECKGFLDPPRLTVAYEVEPDQLLEEPTSFSLVRYIYAPGIALGYLGAGVYQVKKATYYFNTYTNISAYPLGSEKREIYDALVSTRMYMPHQRFNLHESTVPQPVNPSTEEEAPSEWDLL